MPTDQNYVPHVFGRANWVAWGCDSGYADSIFHAVAELEHCVERMTEQLAVLIKEKK